MEEMIKVSNPMIDVEYQKLPEVLPSQIPTRKQMKEQMLPKIGDVIGESKVIYVHLGKYRFTCEGNTMPEIGTVMESNGMMYEVTWQDVSKKRFSASFKGFKPNPVVEAPIEDEEITKVI